MTILITGGTGTVGRLLVPRLHAAGHRLRVLTRNPGNPITVDLAVGDLSTGDGIKAALAGVDTVMHCAGAAKRGAEQAIENSGIPWTTLRATQFHTLALLMAEQFTRPPIAMVPAGLRIQPVDAADVADRLAELARSAPAGLVDDLGGPHIYNLDDLTRTYLTAAGRRRPIVTVPFTGAAYRAMREGANLTPAYATGTRT